MTQTTHKLDLSKLNRSYAEVIKQGYGGNSDFNLVLDLTENEIVAKHNTSPVHDDEVYLGTTNNVWSDEDTLSTSVDDLELWIASENFVRDMLYHHIDEQFDIDVDYDLV